MGLVYRIEREFGIGLMRCRGGRRVPFWIVAGGDPRG
jgi:hypothetical protein